MTQKTQILEHLKRVGHITSLEGIRYYGAMRTQARINDLRNEGYNIRTDMIKEDSGRGYYAKYCFVSSEKIYLFQGKRYVADGLKRVPLKGEIYVGEGWFGGETIKCFVQHNPRQVLKPL
jgi:hypothetical protein